MQNNLVKINVAGLNVHRKKYKQPKRTVLVFADSKTRPYYYHLGHLNEQKLLAMFLQNNRKYSWSTIIVTF